ncbi:MAG: DUF4145 domain-containing protein, partial [Deltaproteobacteria bacterium]|nr:DUF4145 domain-containing protein [Deltaproteobacteria bacterium]
MKKQAQTALGIVKSIKSEVPISYVPPSQGTKAYSQSVFPISIVSETRGYIERVVNQINGCYEKGWFDGCAVMMRRLLETLIIECYEAHGLANNIKDSNTGDFYFLSSLIQKVSSETTWTLGRITRKALPNLKTIGDLSAHSRRYNAHREDIDKIIPDFRIVC